MLWVGRAAGWLGQHQEAHLLTADPLLWSSAPVVTESPDQHSCVHAHAHTHTHTYTYTHTHRHIYTQTHRETHIHTYTHADTHTQTHIRTHTHTHTHNTHTHTHVDTYTHIHVHAHTCARAHTRVHTHTHACTHSTHAHARTHMCTHTCTSACAREPEHCCGDLLGHCSVQLSPQRQVGACSDGFAPLSSEDGTEWPSAAHPCSPPQTSRALGSAMLKTVGPSPVQLSCWEKSTSPPEHMHACSHMPTHVQEVTGTHTNTQTHTSIARSWCMWGPLPWLRARPLL